MNTLAPSAVSMRRTTILFIAVFLMQFGGSVGGTGIPLFAKFKLDSSVWMLAIIGTTGALTYTVVCLSIGALVGRVRPLYCALAGATVQAFTYALAMLATENWHLVLVSLGGGAGQGLFWPMIEGVISEGADGHRLNRRIGLFNVSWSLADSLGAAAAGSLYVLGPRLPFIGLIAATAGVVTAIMVARKRPVDGPERLPARFAHDAPSGDGAKEVNGRFRKAAWVGNFISSGVTNIVRSVFAAPAKDVFRMSSPTIGLALGMLNIMRTLSFVTLREWPGWHYKARTFLVFDSLLALGLTGLVAAAFMPPSAATAAAFISLAAMGIGSGMMYYSSIFYAVDLETVATSTARLHEAVLGAGGALAVLAAGTVGKLADGSAAGAVSPIRALSPFVMAAAVVTVGIVISGRYVAARNSGRNVLELAVGAEYSEGETEA